MALLLKVDRSCLAAWARLASAGSPPAMNGF